MQACICTMQSKDATPLHHNSKASKWICAPFNSFVFALSKFNSKVKTKKHPFWDSTAISSHFRPEIWHCNQWKD